MSRCGVRSVQPVARISGTPAESECERDGWLHAAARLLDDNRPRTFAADVLVCPNVGQATLRYRLRNGAGPWRSWSPNHSIRFRLLNQAGWWFSRPLSAVAVRLRRVVPAGVAVVARGTEIRRIVRSAGSTSDNVVAFGRGPGTTFVPADRAAVAVTAQHRTTDAGLDRLPLVAAVTPGHYCLSPRLRPGQTP